MSLTKEEQARVLENYKYQIIGGKIVMMAPPANANHAKVMGGMYFEFSSYLRKIGCKKCRVYPDGHKILIKEAAKRANVELPKECDKDFYVPDVMVICDKSIDTIRGVIGAPDLVVEVLSPKTAKYDLGLKKDVYEIIGVKEYWIIDIKNRSISVYTLKEENNKEEENNKCKYGMPEMYYQSSAEDIVEIEKENELLIEYDARGLVQEIVKEFSPTIFPELVINVDEIFDDLLE